MTPRMLHPGAWWAWALGLAIAASRTTNPLLLGLIVVVAAYVVAARRPVAPWSRSFGFFLRIGLAVIIIRVGFAIIVGLMQGMLTTDSVISALYDGMRLATILACVGAANSLASPARLLKAVPAALYEVGVAVIVTVTFAPQLVTDLDRVRASRRLRGRTVTGVRGTAGAALPVLEGALERSVTLAAAMDSRGYGRMAQRSVAARRVTAALLLGGLTAAVVGIYALLDASAPAALGLPMLAVGAACAILGFVLAGRRSTRTRYRPDPWVAPEWAVLACAIATVAGVVVAGQWPGLDTIPPAWPIVPPLAISAVLISLLPAWITPPVPQMTVVTRELVNA